LALKSDSFSKEENVKRTGETSSEVFGNTANKHTKCVEFEDQPSKTNPNFSGKFWFPNMSEF
jgi:hypothetical protein